VILKALATKSQIQPELWEHVKSFTTIATLRSEVQKLKVAGLIEGHRGVYVTYSITKLGREKIQQSKRFYS
jgi:hypothetical protein